MTAIDAAQLLVRSFTMLLPILPAGLLLIASIKKRWLEPLNRPIDFGATLGGKPLFGPNKNWRGALIYVGVGTGTVYLLHLASQASEWVAPVFRQEPLTLGLAWSSAYVAGELLNSFVKRRLNIAAGLVGGSTIGAKIQRFFDNTDGSLATGLVLILGYHVAWPILICSFVLGFLAHVATDELMRRLRLKKK